ncbi:MAG: T9SS type A sorting domain-containing protein, partial [Bacteroidota bacterium]
GNFGNTTRLLLDVDPLVVGQNNITARIRRINGVTDQGPADNEVSLSIEYSTDLDEFTLNILPDNFPEEISWQVQNQNNEIVAVGGGQEYAANAIPFQPIRESLCLDGDGCYVLVMFDGFGDGIPGGVYSIIGPEGDTLLNQDGDYGFGRSSIFCYNSPVCELRASYVVIYDSGDGKNDVSIVPEGGAPPYEYSIDGGNTFQSDSIFRDLESLNYDIVVRDSTASCQYQDSLILSGVTPIEDLEKLGYMFDVKPNPNNGLFQIEFRKEGLRATRINFEVLDIRGKVVQARTMSSYNGVFTAPISLVAYPKGLYFVRVYGEDFSWTRKVFTR